MLLSSLSVLFHFYVVYSASCGCSSVNIPVHVDTLVLQDPTDPFASSLRRVDAIYNVYGVFCQPNTVSHKRVDVLQLLVPGFAYTSQYWSPPVEEFQNYSYSAFSCDRGLASLAIDTLGVGLSSRPSNASDVQSATIAAAVSQLGRHLKSASIIPGVRPFEKIIAIGHSAGSALLNYGAIVEGPQSPFDGLILTADLIVDPNSTATTPETRSARDVEPLRWGTIDSSYVTTSNRSILYPPDPTSFSPRMLIFDEFTKDVGSLFTFSQFPTLPSTTNFTGPVAKVVGSEDQLFCTETNRCDNVTALIAAERVAYPDARSFDVVVSQGSGHDLNLDFFAQGAFNTFVGFVDQFSGLM